MTKVSDLVKEIKKEMIEESPELKYVIGLAMGDSFIAEVIEWVKAMKKSGHRCATREEWKKLIGDVAHDRVDALISSMEYAKSVLESYEQYMDRKGVQYR